MSKKTASYGLWIRCNVFLTLFNHYNYQVFKYGTGNPSNCNAAVSATYIHFNRERTRSFLFRDTFHLECSGPILCNHMKFSCTKKIGLLTLYSHMHLTAATLRYHCWVDKTVAKRRIPLCRDIFVFFYVAELKRVNTYK